MDGEGPGDARCERSSSHCGRPFRSPFTSRSAPFSIAGVHVGARPLTKSGATCLAKSSSRHPHGATTTRSPSMRRVHRSGPGFSQLGQGRGGFYSYERLENLVGCDIHNVTEIRPELQRLRVGETIRMHANRFGPAVAIVDPGRALVLGGPPQPGGSNATWSFYLFDGPGGTTRLLERGRNAEGKGVAEKLGFGPYLIDPVGFVMSRKMLRTIKRLAESRAVKSPSGSTSTDTLQWASDS
jgi:hypothetical protein